MGKTKKVFENLAYFEDLELDSSYATKPMFGCLAVYYHGLNVAVLAADPGDKTFGKKKFKFDLWDGVLLPTSREYHELLQKDFPDLSPHPVLGKWLYLPQQTEGFEEQLMKIVRLIRQNDYRLGITPGAKKKKKKSPKLPATPAKSKPRSKKKKPVAFS